MKLDSKEPMNKEIIDLLYKQFYSGSLKPTTEKDKNRIKDFLTSENYVRAGRWHCELQIFLVSIISFLFSEFNYHNITSGNNIHLFKTIRTPFEYLHTFRESIAKGAHLTRLAVQEPLGKF